MKKLYTFFTAIIVTTSALAQIPNGGFETWTNASGYNTPTGWDNLNSMTSSMSTYTCEKGTPGNPGASYLQLTSKSVMGMGVMPGVAVSGTINMATFQPMSGFAYSSRPASLTGSWQYMASGSDQGHAMVLLSKWNSAMSMRDTVAYTDYALPGMAMSWATFTVPLTYMTGQTPDSAIIVLSSSNTTPVAGSMLYVDNLAFAGTVPSSVANVITNASSVSVFPNPATGNTTVSYHSISGKDIRVFVCDIAGKNVIELSSKTVIGNNNIPLNISNLTKGIYTVKVIDVKTTQVQKLVIE